MSYEILLSPATIRATLSAMGRIFSSHVFIQNHTRANQVAYVQALQAEVDNGSTTPFQVVHTHIVTTLRDSGYVQQIDTVRDADIFGNQFEVAQWERLE